jgi:hypothetical protein
MHRLKGRGIVFKESCKPRTNKVPKEFSVEIQTKHKVPEEAGAVKTKVLCRQS